MQDDLQGADRTRGMVRVAGGVFTQGAGALYPEEHVRPGVCVGDFWIDATPVTNDEFARFVDATGHVTLAETAPDPRDYPGMLPEMASAGSAVFVPPRGSAAAPAVPGTIPDWWQFVFGADWKHPSGAGSNIVRMGDHPVVHVALADVEAYCGWARKALPTEAEWEYAARGGLDGATYAWGDVFEPGGVPQAKTWRGTFPAINRAPAGLERTAPVKSYPANGYGLFDMIGNVWEWTADWSGGAPVPGNPCCGAAAKSATGTGQRILKGGSHLCAPNYCQRYRPAARWIQPADTSTSHVGFRCVLRA